jgi:hypothetical protein
MYSLPQSVAILAGFEVILIGVPRLGRLHIELPPSTLSVDLNLDASYPTEAATSKNVPSLSCSLSSTNQR